MRLDRIRGGAIEEFEIRLASDGALPKGLKKGIEVRLFWSPEAQGSYLQLPGSTESSPIAGVTDHVGAFAVNAGIGVGELVRRWSRRERLHRQRQPHARRGCGAHRRRQGRRGGVRKALYLQPRPRRAGWQVGARLAPRRDRHGCMPPPAVGVRRSEWRSDGGATPEQSGGAVDSPRRSLDHSGPVGGRRRLLESAQPSCMGMIGPPWRRDAAAVDRVSTGSDRYRFGRTADAPLFLKQGQVSADSQVGDTKSRNRRCTQEPSRHGRDRPS